MRCGRASHIISGSSSWVHISDTNAVHISVTKDGYKIDQTIDGETIDDVLDYVDWDTKKMVRTLETWVKRSIKQGRITVEEGKEFLNTYRSGLYGYTYLE